MFDVHKLPINMPPGYYSVEVGDVFIMIAGKKTVDEHIHYYQITRKATRYEQLTCKLVKCVYNGSEMITCNNAPLVRTWDDFKKYELNLRWLKTEAAKVLFGGACE